MQTVNGPIIEAFKPQTDFTLDTFGSVWILTPVTIAAQDWVAVHLPEDAQMWASGFVIEHGYVDNVVAGILQDGLSI